MSYTIENKYLKISASSHGGELTSILEKGDNTEYLWSGDERYWKYHAPVLFPIVGKVNEGKYIVEGKTYELPQHGLARTKDFILVEEDEDKLTFELTYSEETLKVYPYKFKLRIIYTLKDNSIKTTYEVINIDEKDMYFSIGGHPAYMCPFKDDETIEDYYFEFDENENVNKILLNEYGMLTHNEEKALENSKTIDLSFKLFNNDAIVFDSLKSKSISIKSRKNNKTLTMDFEGFPYLGLWTKATGAPFVCIEPWCGHADYEDFHGEFKDKNGVNNLKVGEKFAVSYTVTIA